MIAKGTSGSFAIQSKGKQKEGVNPTIVDTTLSRGNTFQLTPQYSLMIMAQVARLSLITRVSDKTISEIIKMEISKLQHLSHEYGFDASKIISHIPLAKKTVMQRLGLDIELCEMICCPECFKLYPIPTIPNTDEEVALMTPIQTTCTRTFYSEARKFVKKIDDKEVLCDEKLMEIEGSGKQTIIRPKRSFCFYTLKKWLARKLCLPGFEKLLDSSLQYDSSRNGTMMSDVWDGTVWRTLLGPSNSKEIYTSKPGNLVFSLYVDWFNPFGNKVGGSSVSLGAIALVCLNLPLQERYKVENIFLFGIIPGPREPKLDQMNNVLEPLILEMMEFWEGVWFASTSQFPEGRQIHAAIFPLIGDLPAIRKTAGFAGHSATKFCSLCEITLQDINAIEISMFKARTHESHMEKVGRWEACKEYWGREKIATEEGARGSILNKLPYWRPVEYCGIEVMHVLLLGNLKDHSHTYLRAFGAGKELEKRLKQEKNWKKTHHGKDFFKGLKFPDLKRRKTPDADSSGTEDEERAGRKRRLLSSKNLTRLSKITEDVAGPSKHQYRLRSLSSRGGSSRGSETPSQNSQDSRDSRTTTHRYELRSRSVVSASSIEIESDIEMDQVESQVEKAEVEGEEEQQEGNEEGDYGEDEPGISKEELRVLHDVITHTIIPTWVSRVPKKFGMSGAGSLKASEWFILYTVYFPLAIVPYWVIGNDWQSKRIKGESGLTHREVLRDSTLKIIEITNIIMKHQIDSSDIQKFSQLINEYRHLLRHGWPSVKSKPNIHVTQHYPEVIKRFGPPMATAAWAQERLNGMLGKIPNNSHLGM